MYFGLLFLCTTRKTTLLKSMLFFCAIEQIARRILG